MASHLDNHDRRTVQKIFQHATSSNVACSTQD